MLRIRYVRFSIRRLLILTAVVAALLYVLYLRPTAVARKYCQQMQLEAQANLVDVSRQHFDNMKTEGAKIEVRLHPRSWSDVFKCQQLFTISMARPVPGKPRLWTVGVCDYYATPLGVQELGGPDYEIAEKRQPAEPPAAQRISQ